MIWSHGELLFTVQKNVAALYTQETPNGSEKHKPRSACLNECGLCSLLSVGIGRETRSRELIRTLKTAGKEIGPSPHVGCGPVVPTFPSPPPSLSVSLSSLSLL